MAGEKKALGGNTLLLRGGGKRSKGTFVDDAGSLKKGLG